MGVPVARTEPEQPDANAYVQKAAFLLSYKYVNCRGLNHLWRPDNEGLRPYHISGSSNPRMVLEEWYPCADPDCECIKKIRYLPIPNRRRGKYQPKFLLVEDSVVIEYPNDGSYRADPGLDLSSKDVRQFRAQQQFRNIDLKSLGWDVK